MKLSVITVVYNDCQNIERTIKSVLNQTYNNIEYIVVDGCSNDGTIEIIKKYKKSISTFISEPDNGIYDAMNKGISLATGEYCCFMNSNDQFVNDHVIENLFKHNQQADILYGDTIIVNNGKEEIAKPLSLNKFWKRIPICHQSAFIKLELQKEYPYKLKYKVSSIYDFFYNCFYLGKKFQYVELPVSKYDMNGYSSYSFYWLFDYFRIAWKYSGVKRFFVIGKLFSYTVMRVLAYLKHKTK